jgi:hypothetical protein
MVLFSALELDRALLHSFTPFEIFVYWDGQMKRTKLTDCHIFEINTFIMKGVTPSVVNHVALSWQGKGEDQGEQTVFPIICQNIHKI